MKAPLLLLASVVLVADIAAAAPGDPRLLRGTLQWPSVLNAEPFVVLRADDGRLYYADVSRARRHDGPISGRVSVVGVEGLQAHEVGAIAIGAGDSALAAAGTAPAAAESVAASPPTAAPAAPAAASAMPADDLWRVHGTVQSVAGSDVVVTTASGQTYRVDASRLSLWTLQTLRVGDEVKLFGIPEHDRRLVANGFIHLSPPPAASPPPAR